MTQERVGSVSSSAWSFLLPLPSPPRYAECASPLGPLLLVSDGRSLTGLYMLPDHLHLPRIEEHWLRDRRCFRQAEDQLRAYFAGESTAFDLPLAPRGTAFQRAVWAHLMTIPYGRTTTYREIAGRIGRPTAPRAVGAANGRNPISIVVPCHRVVGSDGSLTGYGGGLERKAWLLERERRTIASAR